MIPYYNLILPGAPGSSPSRVLRSPAMSVGCAVRTAGFRSLVFLVHNCSYCHYCNLLLLQVLLLLSLLLPILGALDYGKSRGFCNEQLQGLCISWESHDIILLFQGNTGRSKGSTCGTLQMSRSIRRIFFLLRRRVRQHADFTSKHRGLSVTGVSSHRLLAFLGLRVSL